jgi:anti-anti-sigma factor
MKISDQTWNEWSIVEISGDLVLKNLVLAREKFDSLETAGRLKAALDLSQLHYIDSSGVACILNFHKRLSARNGLLVIFGAGADVYDVFSIVGFDKAVTMFPARKDFEDKISCPPV